MILASVVLGRTQAAVEAAGSVLQFSNPVHGVAELRAYIFWFGMSSAGAGPLCESRKHHQQRIQNRPITEPLRWTESQVNSTTDVSSSRGKNKALF